METVLRVRVPGIPMPWKEMMRGCLVVVLLGILCFSVRNDSVMYEVRQPDVLQYALGQGKGCEEAEPVPVCREGHAYGVAAWKEADLSGFCVTMKLHFARFSVFLAIFLVLPCEVLFCHVFQFSRHDPAETVFVSLFPHFSVLLP